MILGVGIDLVELARIRQSILRFGDRFLNRILLPGEIQYCSSHSDPAPSVAARFAAKEAISKAFGTGIGVELGWLDMEVGRLPSGAPHAILHGRGLQLMRAKNVGRILLSLSHTREHATAVAILE